MSGGDISRPENIRLRVEMFGGRSGSDSRGILASKLMPLLCFITERFMVKNYDYGQHESRSDATSFDCETFGECCIAFFVASYRFHFKSSGCNHFVASACDRRSQCFFVALPMRCDPTDHLREAFWGVSIRHYFFLTKTDASSLNVFS